MPVASPCNKTCIIDPKLGICIGCGRTGEEIAGWLGYTDGERRALMERLPLRLTSARPGV